MKRKAYEKELRKLQVELCHLQDWVKAERRARHHRVRRPRRRRQGRHHQGADRAGQPPRVSRHGAAGAVGSRKDPAVSCSATSSAFRPAARSSSSTAAGTIAPASNMSWASSRDGAAQALPEAVVRKSRNTSSMAVSSLIETWLEVGPQEQEKRFLKRISDPMRQWKDQPCGSESGPPGTGAVIPGRAT